MPPVFRATFLCFLLAACSQGNLASESFAPPKSNQSQASSKAMAQAYVNVRYGSLDAAEATFRSLLAEVDAVPPQDYTNQGLYKKRAELASGLAWIDLERGDFAKAKRGFNDTVRQLAKDEQAHLEVVRARDSQQQSAQSALAFGAIGLATALDYKNVQAGTYTQSTSALSVLNSSGLIAELSKPVDTTDQLIHFVNGSTTDTDGVRMIVIPALNGPLSVIGRVTVAYEDGTSMCTGALVGPRTVLTAAHCFTRNDQRARESQVTFTIESANHNSSTRVTAITTPTPIWRSGDFENDWAILEVEQNPSATQDALLADDSFYPGNSKSKWKSSYSKNLYLAGYSSDLNDGRFLTMAAGCSWLGMASKKQGLHRCPSWKGASGGPVLLKHGKAGMESYQVIGITVWSENHNTPDARRGMRLITPEVAAAIRDANGS